MNGRIHPTIRRRERLLNAHAFTGVAGLILANIVGSMQLGVIASLSIILWVMVKP